MKGGIIVGFFSNINKVFSDTDIVAVSYTHLKALLTFAVGNAFFVLLLCEFFKSFCKLIA